jgi:predicted phage tail protein
MIAAGFLFMKSLLGKILGDWKVLLLLVIIVVATLVGLKIRSLEKSLTAASEQIVFEKKNNEILRGNVSTLEAVNKENQLQVNQLLTDKKIALESTKKLAETVATTNKSLENLQDRIDQLKDSPTKLSPYISQAIDGIQKERTK